MVFEAVVPPAATYFGSLIAIIAATTTVIYCLYKSVFSATYSWSVSAKLSMCLRVAIAAELAMLVRGSRSFCRVSYVCYSTRASVLEVIVYLLQVSTVSLSATQQPWNQRSTTPPIAGEFVENTEGNVLLFIMDS